MCVTQNRTQRLPPEKRSQGQDPGWWEAGTPYDKVWWQVLGKGQEPRGPGEALLGTGSSPLETGGMIEPMSVGGRRDNMIQGRICLSQAVERPLLLQTICSGAAL